MQISTLLSILLPVAMVTQVAAQKSYCKAGGVSALMPLEVTNVVDRELIKHSHPIPIANPTTSPALAHAQERYVKIINYLKGLTNTTLKCGAGFKLQSLSKVNGECGCFCSK